MICGKAVIRSVGQQSLSPDPRHLWLIIFCNGRYCSTTRISPTLSTYLVTYYNLCVNLVMRQSLAGVYGDYSTHKMKNLTPRPGHKVPLRSASANLLPVTRCNISFGARGFRSAACTIWNSLTSHVRSCETLTTFRRHLKSHFFHSALPTA